MASDTNASWTNQKTDKTVTGKWVYYWASNKFLIQLDGTDELGLKRHPFETSNDTPEWGDWKLNEKPKL